MFNRKDIIKMNYTNVILIVSLSLGLLSCDNRPNFAQLCSEHPDICNEFKEDTWCKRERIGVGMSNYAFINKESELNQYHRLIAYEKYAKCMDFASQIQHIKLKHKQSIRIENGMLARKRIAEITEKTQNAEHPYLLYFHWSRYVDKAALEKFLKLEGSSLLETPRGQFYLATYYIKRDLDKTLGLLFHALELYKEGDEIESEIFKSISSIFAEKENAKLTYVWLKVAQLNSPEDETIRPETLQSYIDGYGLNAVLLDQVAQATIDKIYLGKFKTPNY